MLHVHRAERADGLVDALRVLLAESPADPFATEIVIPDGANLPNDPEYYADLAPGRLDVRQVTDDAEGAEARAHWPRITKCTRLLRAQQASVSSWQSGSSSP